MRQCERVLPLSGTLQAIGAAMPSPKPQQCPLEAHSRPADTPLHPHPAERQLHLPFHRHLNAVELLVQRY